MRTMFTPLKIAGMEVKNRTFMAPMSLGYESQDGTVNEKMEAYWLRRAQGGVGCIIVDATSVDPNVPYLGNTLCFRDEESIKNTKALQTKFILMAVRSFRRLRIRIRKVSVHFSE
ncbi:hypothetical protein M5E84_09405 [[Ruminococcus] torques]|nr:hypothetical protein M5E84_09405 [[Ruminococcus] torques]